MNIYVGNLSYRTTEEELNEAFSQYGAVESVKIVRDRDSGRSKGFGFVEMTEDGEGEQAINSLNETQFDERTLVVNKARPREERSNDGGGRRPQRGYGDKY